jgi:hypothetical protein
MMTNFVAIGLLIVEGGRVVAGYSGTPLPKKLGIKDRSTVGIIGTAPTGLGVTATPGASVPFDVVLVFVRTSADLAAGIVTWSKLVTPAGGLWICYPKQAAWRRPGFSDVDVTQDHVREFGLPTGLVDNKVCAIDDDWTGLRLVWRVERRAEVARRLRNGGSAS